MNKTSKLPSNRQIDSVVLGYRAIAGTLRPVEIQFWRHQYDGCPFWSVDTVCNGVVENSEKYSRLGDAAAILMITRALAHNRELGVGGVA